MDPKDPNDRREAFAPRFRRQLWITGAVVALVIPLIVLRGSREPLVGDADTFRIVAIAAFVLILGALCASFWNWRCVACNRYLGRRLFVRFCDGCGARLR